jgi:hypothetical protein
LESGSGVDHYEVWRASNTPYFMPGDVGSVQLLPDVESLHETGHLYEITDSSSGIGDVNDNSFYVVRAVGGGGGGMTADSNRVGEMDYALVRDALNAVALPLEDANLLWADDLGVATGSSKVSRWVSEDQILSTHIVGVPTGNFGLETGQAYFVLTTASSDPTVFTTVGGVPDEGSVQFEIVRDTACKLNFLSVPLDHPEIAYAEDLGTSIGGIAKVSRWIATPGILGLLNTHIMGVPNNNFTVQIGYPYMPCAINPGDPEWP